LVSIVIDPFEWWLAGLTVMTTLPITQGTDSSPAFFARPLPPRLRDMTPGVGWVGSLPRSTLNVGLDIKAERAHTCRHSLAPDVGRSAVVPRITPFRVDAIVR